MGRFWALLRFACQLTQIRLSSTPRIDLEIAYDPIGVRVSGWALGKPATVIHHHHEVIVRDGHRHAPAAIDALTRADLVTVADTWRAELIHKLKPGLRHVRALRNFPLKELAADRLVEKSSNFSVVYFGSRGSAQCLDTVVKSMDRWPPDVTLHLYGRPNSEFDAHLLKLASAIGIEHRLKFEGWAQFDKLFERVARHHLGLSLLRPTEDNWRYSAGASNKRFQLMAYGLPQITDNGVGVAEMISGAGISVCPEDPAAIADAVCAYSSDPTRVENEGRAGRNRIRNELNQENEFDPILKFAGFQ
ncbi:MAG: glycosyltransferase [Pseudomonadota bacterium]